MKTLIGTLRVLIGVVLVAACAQSPTEPEPDWLCEGQWGSQGTGNGEFVEPGGVAVGPGGNVYVANTYNHRVQYFTSTGSFLGKWGSRGSGNGQFVNPRNVALDANGDRVYLPDTENHRVQYFKWVTPAVSPTSLGRVRALFR
jgi:DNA-binding beta-propeller fold protein YncE